MQLDIQGPASNQRMKVLFVTIKADFC